MDNEKRKKIKILKIKPKKASVSYRKDFSDHLLKSQISKWLLLAAFMLLLLE